MRHFNVHIRLQPRLLPAAFITYCCFLEGGVGLYWLYGPPTQNEILARNLVLGKSEKLNKWPVVGPIRTHTHTLFVSCLVFQGPPHPSAQEAGAAGLHYLAAA